MNPFAAHYLYGLDEPLDSKVVASYVEALVAVARANGIVASETRILHGVAELLGAPLFSVSRMLDDVDGASLEHALPDLVDSPRLLELLYRDALLVVRADGVTSAEENQVLVKMSTQLGLTKRQRERASLAADALEDLRDVMATLGGAGGAAQNDA